MNFPEVRIKPAELHKVRGYFGRQFQQYDLIHNHDNQKDKFLYRYPSFQFKIHPNLAIHAYKEEGLAILKEIFFTSERIRIEDREIIIHEKQIEVKAEEFGEDGEIYLYEFISPWVALNQKNFKRYSSLDSPKQKQEMLNSIIISNIISFCKFAGYTIKEKLTVKSELYQETVILKDKTHLAFRGKFKVNFLLPSLLGLGKSTSRGYGTIKRIL